MPDELTKALLFEEVAPEDAMADALFASVTGGVPLVQALTEAGAVSPEVLARYLARSDAPVLRQVAPVAALVERLPPGLCARLLALPVRHDAITGTVDVVVADATDRHVAAEFAYHLDAPVRLVRATVPAIEDALRRLRSRSLAPPPQIPESRPPASRVPDSRPAAFSDVRDDERIYDSRPRARSSPSSGSFRGGTLPPPAPSLKLGFVAHHALDALTSEALRASRVPGSDRQAHSVPEPGSSQRSEQLRRATPPWGTPVHNATSSVGSDPPRGEQLGSEIPIPLTRRTFTAVSGGTQRPPPLVDPKDSALGEGYAVDPAHFRQIVEVNERMRSVDPSHSYPPAAAAAGRAAGSVIPGPPLMPAAGAFAAYAPQVPVADIGGILAALRAAGSRDEVLELVLTGARIVALRVALFVVKRGGYIGWACTPEFGDRGALQSITIAAGVAGSAFDEAVRDGLYLGPIRNEEAHVALLHVMRGASRDVAIVPIRVSGKPAVILVADELGDTMLATRRLEELARAAGDAFARIVRMKR